jgi:E3 ubiquitin-protein ligase FANCL
VPTTSLKQLVDQFTDIVERYHDLFACLDELDSKMRILEPETPKRSDVWRLIGLGHHCSVHIELDKHQPRHPPNKVQFFGNQARVKGLKATWQSSAWDESQTPWYNIQRILQGVVVEHKKQDYTQVGEIECGICYFYKHDGTIPDIICTNALCSRSYHPVCLSEWLKSNPDTLQQFDLLFGKCPYCQEVK